MNIQFTLAYRYLQGRKLRSFLTTLAIVFGVLVIFGMNSMLPAFMQALKANVLAAADQVDASITLKTSDVFDASVADRVAAIEGISEVSGMLNRPVNIPADYFDSDPNQTDSITALSVVGVVPDEAQALHAFTPKEGRFLTQQDSTALVISQSLADMLVLEVGSTLTLPGAGGQTDLTVAGILPVQVTNTSEEVYITLHQAQTMFGVPGMINTVEANFDSIETARRAEIENEIIATLGDTYQIGTLSANSELLTNFGLAQTIFNVLGMLALLMGGFIIFNTFRTIVAERKRDIGMLRALGANRSTIFGIILIEGLFQGIAGTAAGILLGYLFALLLVEIVRPIMQGFLNIQISSPAISAGLLAVSILVGVGVTLLAGLIPAMSATRVTPLEALRPSVGTISFKRIAGVGFWTGAILIVLAVAALITQNTGLISLGGVLFIVGLILASPALVNPIANLFGRLSAVLFARSGTAQLAEGNLSRQPGRAAITASTTLIGMAILIMAAVLFTSVKIGFASVMRKSLGSDYILVPPSVAAWGGNIGATDQLMQDLENIEGVAVVSSLRFAPSLVDGVSVSVLGIDPETYPKVSGLTFSEGDEAASYAELRHGRTAIISPVLATNIQAQVGEEIELITPSGVQAYQVTGIGGDYLNAKIATVYLSQENLAADFNRDEDVLLQMNLAPGADTASVEAAFIGILRNYPQFRLINGHEYIEENLKLFDAAFSGVYALVIFLAIPSLIAMVNTLAIGVIERTREIGMLRAVGATRKQVRTIIIAEALILSAIGTSFGIMAGLYMSYMAVKAVAAAGFPLEYAFPAQGILIAVAAGILFGVIAAIIPARQASKLEIIQALRYE